MKLSCTRCDAEILFFRDERSKKNYEMSHLCQSCQDKSFKLDKYTIRYESNGKELITHVSRKLYIKLEKEAISRKTTIYQVLKEFWEMNKQRRLRNKYKEELTYDT